MLYISKSLTESTTCLPYLSSTYPFHKSIPLNHLSTYYTSLKKNTIPKKKTDFAKEDFQIIQPLMKGQYGQVYIVKNEMDQQIYAMKVQNKSYLQKSKDKVFIEHEKAIYHHDQYYSQQQQQQYIPTLYCSFEDSQSIYLVMEYMAGGDLFSLLDRQQPNLILKEDQAKFYMAEIVESIHFLHHRLGYLHRDIKPQNILIDASGHIKLTDFGSSIPIDQVSSSSSSLPVGTCDYISPEILLSFQNSHLSYGVEVDWWSAGVVLYEMLQEVPPFYSDLGEFDTYKKILFHEGSISFNPDFPISDHAKDLINKLLDKKENRLTYEEIKAHPFFYGIDWDHLYQSTPPFQPKLSGPDDISNFSI
ncbi:unnamed protein product [Cunninghamella echinulata]